MAALLCNVAADCMEGACTGCDHALHAAHGITAVACVPLGQFLCNSAYPFNACFFATFLATALPGAAVLLVVISSSAGQSSNECAQYRGSGRRWLIHHPHSSTIICAHPTLSLLSVSRSLQLLALAAARQDAGARAAAHGPLPLHLVLKPELRDSCARACARRQALDGATMGDFSLACCPACLPALPALPALPVLPVLPAYPACHACHVLHTMPTLLVCRFPLRAPAVRPGDRLRGERDPQARGSACQARGRVRGRARARARGRAAHAQQTLATATGGRAQVRRHARRIADGQGQCLSCHGGGCGFGPRRRTGEAAACALCRQLCSR
ncbi:hypothetical protein T492DRAFT_923154 [Pavlovales sp. CCMP2436]|nr:hypothetical protein T492DRAFT_923154 [Pavlovales sp. CCMP2436]